MDDLSEMQSMRGGKDRREADALNLDGDLSRRPSMRGSPDDSLGRIDQYVLTRELGGGGFGTVYLAKDAVSGVEYAVKGLPPEVKGSSEELENIRENFALVSRLSHTNIARAYVLHPVKEVRYASDDVRRKLRVMPGDTLMVMEYAPGVTLSKWRKQFPGNRVPLPPALEIARQIASALDYAHGQRVIHRDIKPSNVMIETKRDGKLVARVLDFGLAAEIRSSMGRVSREIRDTAGTRPFMAPEQWTGDRQGAATDQYALAALFHELVTGNVPFASVFETGDPAVMLNVVAARPPSIPADLPKPVRAALAKALAKNPAERFPSCGAFVDALAGRVKVKGAGMGVGAKAALAAACLIALSVGVNIAVSLTGRTRGGATSTLPAASVTPVTPGNSGNSGQSGNSGRAGVADAGWRDEGVQLWAGGPYWATTNIGAEKPEEYGYYFWWGDTVGYKREGNRWVASDGSSLNFSFGADNTPTFKKTLETLRQEGWITAEGVLAPAHDAARAH